MGRLLDMTTYSAVLRTVVESRKDFAVWREDGLEFVRDDVSDALIFRLRPHYPDVEGRIDARDLMFTQSQAAEVIIRVAHETMARGRGQVFRALMQSQAPIDWIGDGDPDALLVVIDTLMIRLGEAYAEIKNAADARAGL